MKIMIKETGEIAHLSLYEPSSAINSAQEFATERLNLRADNPNSKKGEETYTLPAAMIVELRELLYKQQANMAYPIVFNTIQIEQVHGLIEHDIEKAWEECSNPMLDKFFAAKNALIAEREIWQRLINGKVSVNSPTMLEITDYRHTSTDEGDAWVVRVKCDFFMSMPKEYASYDFTAAMELRYIRAADENEITLEHDEWLFPFSMSAVQEDVVIGTLLRAADKKIGR